MSAADGKAHASRLRVGHGYDIHRLVPGTALVLGGVTLPWDLGLKGHSDGDVACHALIDALLGAAGRGDIGTLFPDGDPRFEGARSVDLLAQVGELLAQDGLALINADITLVLEVPRLTPYRQQMVESIAAALKVEPACISVKAKSNEKLGAIGAGEAIAAMAVALVES